MALRVALSGLSSEGKRCRSSYDLLTTLSTSRYAIHCEAQSPLQFIALQRGLYMSRRYLRLILGLVLSLPCAAAQDSISLGIRLALASSLEAIGGEAPYLGLQLGVRALDPVELRASYDISLGLEYASADLLYSQSLGTDLRGCAGLGPDYYADGWNGETDYGVHGTAGVEYRTGIVGLFVEAQPIYGFGLTALRFRIWSGVNFIF